MLGPKNSLILTYDHLTADEVSALEEQLDEVGSLYEWSDLGAMIQGERVKLGVASVVFTSARRSLFTFATPRLRERGIPFTVFVRTDFVGMNTLPAEDELHLAGPKLKNLSLSPENAWQDPAYAEKVRKDVRAHLGGPPIDGADPLYFSATWRQVLDAGAAEVGLAPSAGSLTSVQLAGELDFIRQRALKPSTLLYLPYSPTSNWEFSQLAIRGVLRGRYGVVDRGTTPYDLPRFRLEKETVK